MPFPFATTIPISKIILEEYGSMIRKGHINPISSIIWEQRRNSRILENGFKTLEGAINNMSNDITSALFDLKNSVTTELNEIKYIQKEQLKSFETSQIYLTKILSSMDNKLYYIEWNRKPLGTFHHR